MANKKHLPRVFSTRINVVKRIKESGWLIKKAANIYHVSRKTTWRWLTKYDGTEESLMDKSHRPHSEHPEIPFTQGLNGAGQKMDGQIQQNAQNDLEYEVSQ